MSSEYLVLGYSQVALAAALVLINGALSWALSLGLGRRLLVASARTAVQLLLVGLLLQWVFSLATPPIVLVWTAAMATIAGIEAVRRTGRRYQGIWFDAMLSIWASSWSITGIALLVVLGVVPWYDPQYAVPLLGMILGNTLTGISLGLDRLLGELATRRRQVELRLTLGATRWEAARPLVRDAARTGMVPILNAMSVVGLVSLPGMMTGQLLAGVEPAEAVKYQIVIMFLIAAGTALGTVAVVLLAYRRLFSSRHQLLSDRLREVGGR